MNGIKVYEAIVELQALDTSIKQIEYIKKLREIIKILISIIIYGLLFILFISNKNVSSYMIFPFGL